MRRLFLYSLVLLVLFAAPVAADDEKEGEKDPSVVLRVGEQQVEMEAFLRVVSKATGVPLIWNPADKNIRGKKIIGNVDLSMPRDELFSYARSLLTFYELVIIPLGPKGHRVHVVMDARQTAAILRLKPEHVVITDENADALEDDDGRYLTTTIPVQHLQDLRNARNGLTRIITGQNIGNVTEVPTARAFLVTDFAPNVVACYRLIKQMDVPQAKASTASGKTIAITLEHAQAVELARVLAQHYMPRIMRVAGRAPPTPQAGAPRITADARTNRLLVTGDDAEIAAVQQAVRLLDVPVAAARPPTPPAPVNVMAHVVHLKHVEASDASHTLMNFVHSSPGLFAEGAAKPAVTSHDDTGMLLISATKKDFEVLQRLITELDKP